MKRNHPPTFFEIMARKYSRFKNLMRDLRKKATAPEVVAFGEYMNGNRQQNTPTRPTNTAINSTLIIPFNRKLGAATADIGDMYITTISDHAYSEGMGKFGFTDNDLGYKRPTAGYQSDSNFYPAVLRVMDANGTITTPTSGITGREYRKMGGTSYSFPFGQVTGITEEQDQRLTLTNAARARNALARISYDPEVFRARRTGRAVGSAT